MLILISFLLFIGYSAINCPYVLHVGLLSLLPIITFSPRLYNSPEIYIIIFLIIAVLNFIEFIRPYFHYNSKIDGCGSVLRFYDGCWSWQFLLFSLPYCTPTHGGFYHDQLPSFIPSPLIWVHRLSFLCISPHSRPWRQLWKILVVFRGWLS